MLGFLQCTTSARVFLIVASLLTNAGCAVSLDSQSMNSWQLKLNDALQSKQIVLLGEIHDNAKQHAMRVLAFENLLLKGKRPALLMEQFDREHQAAIDLARKQAPDNLASLIAAGSPGKQGWNWNFYSPFLALAIKYELPIVAANVSNADALKAMRGGLAALSISVSPNSQLIDKQAEEIFNGHCQMMPMAAAKTMVNAQIAKDIVMAHFVMQYQPQGVVLLAGNGHVRNDIGIPFWLSPSARENSVSIGLLESDASANQFDVKIVTTAPTRDDPCKAFRQ
jgi:uncharacterized iron-regulated protein